MLASDWLNCTGKPITCYDTEVGQFDDHDVKGTDVATVDPQNKNCHSDSKSSA